MSPAPALCLWILTIVSLSRLGLRDTSLLRAKLMALAEPPRKPTPAPLVNPKQAAKAEAARRRRREARAKRRAESSDSDGDTESGANTPTFAQQVRVAGKKPGLGNSGSQRQQPHIGSRQQASYRSVSEDAAAELLNDMGLSFGTNNAGSHRTQRSKRRAGSDRSLESQLPPQRYDEQGPVTSDRKWPGVAVEQAQPQPPSARQRAGPARPGLARRTEDVGSMSGSARKRRSRRVLPPELDNAAGKLGSFTRRSGASPHGAGANSPRGGGPSGVYGARDFPGSHAYASSPGHAVYGPGGYPASSFAPSPSFSSGGASSPYPVQQQSIVQATRARAEAIARAQDQRVRDQGHQVFQRLDQGAHRFGGASGRPVHGR